MRRSDSQNQMNPYFSSNMSQKYKIRQFNSVLGSKRSLSCVEQKFFDQAVLSSGYPTPVADHRGAFNASAFNGSFYNALYAPLGSEPNKDILDSNSFDAAND